MKNRKSQSKDWYTLIIGEGTVNEGMARFLLAITTFIVVFGTIMWAIWPS